MGRKLYGDGKEQYLQNSSEEVKWDDYIINEQEKLKLAEEYE